MIDRLAVDTNAVVDYFRANRPTPPALLEAREVVLPLVVLGELYAGAYASERVSENLGAIERLAAMWPLLSPDAESARIYGEIRAQEQRLIGNATIDPARKNDLWIAALCLQHNVPLLTNDKAFDRVEGLVVVHW